MRGTRWENPVIEQTTGKIEFLVLGPLRVLSEGEEVRVTRPKQRALLALLLLHPNELMSQDRLIDALWGESPPPSAASALHGHVADLRKLIGRERLLTEPPGYRLHVSPDELDLARFERLLADARSSAEPSTRAELTCAALALWRESPLPDLAYDAHFARELDRLTELRVGAIEERAEADLELGRHHELVSELEPLVAEYPYRERLWGQLMLALYRSGRQADALAVYRSARRRIVEQLGIDPSPWLQQLEQRILVHDERLQPRGAVGTPAPTAEIRTAPRAKARRTVTVLFCDVAGSTDLGERFDPEVLQDVMSRYFDAAQSAIERHGGTVEKFIGDAVMAVFGLPELHEDDALRAARAALDLRGALAPLNAELERDFDVRIAIRIGINTGEVITGDATSGQRLVTGDPVNLAARLEQAAGPDEVLVGQGTEQLVRHGTRLEAVEPLELKGKSGAVRAWRLIDVLDDVPAVTRRLDTPLVGRDAELRTLKQAFASVVERQALALVTVVGPPGIGKSRLANELAASAGSSARVLVGRCLPYGEGITYWPLAELVRQINVASVVDRPDGDQVSRLVAAAVGTEVASIAPSEETAWAFRKLFEALAREQPLLVILDDIQWAEQTLLDLLEYVAGFSSGASILLVCLARPDLFVLRPTWAEPRPNARVLTLQPLSEDESTRLIDSLLRDRELPEGARSEIVATSSGNPLFVEQMLALELDEEAGELLVPPTLHALLAARIDRLDPDERAVVERGAIEGRVFHRGAVAQLLPTAAQQQLGPSLLSLVHKDIVRPDSAHFAGEDAFCFGHILIRDAAYASVPKSSRGELHERLGEWLEQKSGAQIVEYEAIVGYHFEQAFRYRRELTPSHQALPELGRRAAERLGRAGERALAQGDANAATNLLERAATTASDDGARAILLQLLGSACWEAGDLEAATRSFDEAIATADRQGDRRTAARAGVGRARVRAVTTPSGPDWLRAEAKRLIAVLEELQDDLGLANAWLLMTDARNFEYKTRAAIRAADQARIHARRAGARREETEATGWVVSLGVFVVEPARETAARYERILAEADGPAVEAHARFALGAIRVLQGDVVEGRRLYTLAHETYRDLGMGFWAVGMANVTAYAELAAGDLECAESQLRQSADELEAMGEASIRSTILANLARTLVLQGRDDEAERCAAESLALSSGDVVNELICGGVRARIAARRGDFETAIALAEQALARFPAPGTDAQEAELYMDLAEVMRLAGRHDRAAAALEQALRMYEQKEDVASAEKARRMLARAPA